MPSMARNRPVPDPYGPMSYMETARLRSRLTRSELCERAGISKQTLSLIENGTRSPNDRVLIALARAMDLDALEMRIALGPAGSPRRDHE